MDWLMKARVIILRCFQIALQTVLRIFQNSKEVIIACPQWSDVLKLNDSVHQLHMPTNGRRVTVEIVFIHGFRHQDSSTAYVDTWTSYDGSDLWPKTWLPEKFPGARVLSVSYDSCAARGLTQGRMDICATAETLLASLTDLEQVGTQYPLILVGHDLGGLIIKQMCLLAAHKEKHSFLISLKGVFYYSTPHAALSNLDAKYETQLMEGVVELGKDWARLNEDFRKLRTKYHWKTEGLGAAHGRTKRYFDVEAFGRFDTDDFRMIPATADAICKPQNTNSHSFSFLTQFILSVLTSTSTGSRRKSKLLFLNDKFYVPLEISAAQVLGALKTEQVVVLCGGPGSGKTSLARYLALKFQQETNNQHVVSWAPSSEQTPYFTDGVYFLPCGSDVDLRSKMRELLQELGVKLIEDEEEPLDIAGLRRRLGETLEERDALVIIDDVWERTVVEELVVPGQVKYLLTSQDSTSWDQYCCVSIRDLDPEQARKLVAGHVGFSGGVIPGDLKEIVNDVLEATGCNPLALATLSRAIDKQRLTMVTEWQEVKKNLFEYLKVERNRPVGFGRSYPLTVHSSMMFAVNKLDPQVKSLLYIIALFEGPWVPEPVVRLVLNYTQPPDSCGRYDIRRKHLQGLTLVQFYSEVRDSVSVGFLSVHGLRQHFILGMELEDVARLSNFLQEGSPRSLEQDLLPDVDLATALCAVYGVKQVRERAVRKLAAMGDWDGFERCGQLRTLLIPFLSMMLNREENSTKFRRDLAAGKVFWTVVSKGELDDFSISCLLSLQDTSKVTCNILSEMELFFRGTRHGFDVEKLPRSLAALVALLSEEVGDPVRRVATKALANLACATVNRSPIREFDGALDRIISMLSNDIHESTQEQALRALTNVALETDKGQLCIMKFPNALERLVALLSNDVDGIRLNAAGALRNLACVEVNNQHIQNFPSALKGLVSLLSEDVDESVQKAALGALANVATCETTQLSIGAIPYALERLVALLSKDAVRSEAARALRNLAVTERNVSLIREVAGALDGLISLLTAGVNEAIPEDALVIVQNLTCQKELHTETGGGKQLNNAIEVLISLLLKGVNEPIQVKAMTALGNLGHNCNECKLHIVTSPHVLGRLVALLSKDVSDVVREEAAGTLANLAGYVKTNELIGEFSGSLQGLTSLLSNGVNDSIQQEALRALGNLCQGSTENMLRIAILPDVLERLVALLSLDVKGGVRRQAARVLAILAIPWPLENERPRLIGGYAGALEGLISQLGDINESIQEQALRALANLAHGSKENRFRIPKQPGILGRLVALLSEDFAVAVRKEAARVLANLALENENKRLIASFAGAVGDLISLLSEDVDESIQQEATIALARLVLGSQENQLLLANTANALSRLTPFLSEDFRYPDQRQLQATMFMANLAFATENKSLLGESPAVLEGFVSLLAKGVDAEVQRMALIGLSEISIGGEINQLRIASLPAALERMVALLSSESVAVQGQAAQILANLAEAPENKGRIIIIPGALEWLVSLLSKSENQLGKKNALRVLRNLGDGHFEFSLQIGSFPGALEAVAGLLTESMNESIGGQVLRTLEVLSRPTGNQPRIAALLDAVEGISGGKAAGSFYRYMSFLKVNLKDYEGALLDITKATKSDANIGFYWQERGLVKRLLQDNEGALADLSRALELDPDDYEVLKHRALVKHLLKDEAGAAADAEWAIRLRPSRVDDIGYGEGCLGVLPVEFLHYKLQ